MSASETAPAQAPASPPAAQPPTPVASRVPLAEAATRVALLSSSLLLAFMLGLEVVASLGFFVRVPVGPLHLPLAAVLSLAAGFFVARRLFGPRGGIAALAAVASVEIALVVTAVLVSGAVYDVTYDGQTYQQEGVIQLARGWNPLSGDEKRLGKNSLWVAHYAKGPWMQEAALYVLTGHIEQGKAFHWLLILVAFTTSLALLLAVLPRAPASAVLLAGVVALNPVAVAQATSFYVDGMSASLLTVILAAVCLLLSRRHGDWVPLAVLAAATVLLINVKATGLAYALVLLLGAVLFLLLGQTPLPTRTVLAVVSLSVVAGVAVVGFSPYVTNTVDHGTPLYPLTGSIDIMTPNTPGNLVGRDRFSKLGMSLFARSQNAYGKIPLETKWPFELDRSEVEIFMAPDVRASGFGPLFAAGLVLTVLVAVLARLRRREDGEDRVGPQAVVLSVLILVSVLATAEGWWARYAPQFWLLPVIVAVLAIRKHGWRPAGLLARGLCLLLAADIALVAYGSITHKVESAAELRRELARLAAEPPVRVAFGAFESNRVRLEEANVRFSTASSTLTSGGEPFPFSEAVIYPGED